MKKIIAFLLIIFMLLGTVPFSGTANAAGTTAKSVTARIYVNGGYQPTEAYQINSVYYYKIQDIAASVRDLSVRFTYARKGNNLEVTKGKNHTLKGTEYSAANLRSYTATKGGKVKVDKAEVNVSGYIINGNFCLSIKEAGKLLNCGFKAVGKGRGTDYQLMTSYKYNAKGKLVRRLSSQGNTAFNRMGDGFAASYKDNIYYINNGAVYKMNNAGSKINTLVSANAMNLNIANERLYYTVGGHLYSIDLDGNDMQSHGQPYYVSFNQYMKKILIVDDSVYCIYNEFDGWSDPASTTVIYQYEMMGRDMIPDTWLRNTLVSVPSASIYDNKIESFYIDGGYLYYTGLWVNRVKLGDYGKTNNIEVLAEGEWYQQQKFSKGKIIMMGNEGTTKWESGKNGRLYIKSDNEKGNWSMFFKQSVYSYTVTEDKLIYLQGNDLYARDIDDIYRNDIYNYDYSYYGANIYRFGLAGDWIVARLDHDVSRAETILIKLDGTKPSVKY